MVEPLGQEKELKPDAYFSRALLHTLRESPFFAHEGDADQMVAYAEVVPAEAEVVLVLCGGGQATVRIALS